MRREVDAALRRLADVVAQVTNLLGVVTAPPPESATVRHVEVLLLQPQLVMVVVITSTGAVTKRVFAFDAPVDPRALRLGRRPSSTSASPGCRSARGMIERASPTRRSTPRERAFLEALAPAVTDLDAEEAAGASSSAARRASWPSSATST